MSAYGYRDAYWNEGAYSVGALIDKNKFEGALILEGGRLNSNRCGNCRNRNDCVTISTNVWEKKRASRDHAQVFFLTPLY